MILESAIIVMIPRVNPMTNDPRASFAPFIQELRQRHPDATTVCGLLHRELTDGEDRLRAAMAIGVWGCRRSIPALKRLARESTGPLQREAIYSLGLMRDQAAFLQQLLREAELDLVRDITLEALGCCRDVNFDLVLTYVHDGADERVLASALYALLCHSYGSERRAEAVSRIASYLEHPNWLVRCHAAEILVLTSREEVMKLLHDPHAPVREHVRDLLVMYDEQRD